MLLDKLFNKRQEKKSRCLMTSIANNDGIIICRCDLVAMKLEARFRNDIEDGVSESFVVEITIENKADSLTQDVDEVMRIDVLLDDGKG